MPGLQRARVGDGIEVLRLDRPERRNALDSATLAELLDALDELARDDDLRVLVFSTTSEIRPTTLMRPSAVKFFHRRAEERSTDATR